jgi:hypothetical protein
MLEAPLTISQAIAREEGWLDPDSRCRRNHNPGNINFGSFAMKYGATLEEPFHGEEPRFACFSSDEVGFVAIRDLLSLDYKGMTIMQAITKWAPPGDNNNTTQYIRNICAWTELDPTDIIDEHL